MRHGSPSPRCHRQRRANSYLVATAHGLCDPGFGVKTPFTIMLELAPLCGRFHTLCRPPPFFWRKMIRMTLSLYAGRLSERIQDYAFRSFPTGMRLLNTSMDNYLTPTVWSFRFLTWCCSTCSYPS